MKKIQDKIKKFCEENNLKSQVEYNMLDLSSEIGEISKEILKMTSYGKKPLELNENIKYELGDAFYSLVVLANSLDINLEEALDLVLEKYSKRLKKGSADSEKD